MRSRRGSRGLGLVKADELLSRGISIDQLIETLLDRLRDLMVMAACGAASGLVDLSEATRAAGGLRGRRGLTRRGSYT